MAEFSEVMTQYKRMCDSNSCIGCPMEGNCGLQDAKLFPDVFEKCVMEWANAHPEPVYPTWYEWLKEQGILYQADPATINDKGNEPIPADIAKKLGIKPKEG